MAFSCEPFSPRNLHYSCAEHFPKTSFTAAAPLAMTYYSRQGGDATEPKRIGFIVADGTSSFDLLGSVEAFAVARIAGTQGDGGPCYESLIIGVDAKSFLASSGAAIKAHHTIRNAPALDTIVIPGGVGLQNSEAAQKIAAWLTDRVKTTRRIEGVSQLVRTTSAVRGMRLRWLGWLIGVLTTCLRRGRY